jgi:hypothetical protein
MTEVGSALLDKARILVKIPDTSLGTIGGVGASDSWFGKGFSFEGYVTDASGNKKHMHGLLSLIYGDSAFKYLKLARFI